MENQALELRTFTCWRTLQAFTYYKIEGTILEFTLAIQQLQETLLLVTMKLSKFIAMIFVAATTVDAGAAGRSKICSNEICSKCAQIALHGVGSISIQRSCDVILRAPRCCAIRSYRLL